MVIISTEYVVDKIGQKDCIGGDQLTSAMVMNPPWLVSYQQYG